MPAVDSGSTDNDRAERLLHEILAMPAPDSAHCAHQTRPPRQRPRLVLTGAALVAIGTACALVITVVGSGNPITKAPPAGALERLAQVAAAAPAQGAPGPGQYLYTDSIETNESSTYPGSNDPASGFTALVPEHRQIWIGPDGSGRLYETFGTPQFLTPHDEANWVAAGRPSLGDGASDTVFDAGGLSTGPTTDLANLPTDPTALAQDISSRKVEGGPPGAAEDFTQIGDLLRETAAPPALRSALYQVAAQLPGVEVLGTVTDHSGRHGIGVGYTSHGVRNELIFDPSTSALMGEQTVVTGTPSVNGEPTGTVLDWTVYLKSAIVDTIGTPTPGATHA
jgi:hypothetical protein